MLGLLSLNLQHVAYTRLINQLRQAVVSAVYVYLHSNSTRLNDIIITGVPKEGNTSEDKFKVEDLFQRELT